jgi:hypothetical protein
VKLFAVRSAWENDAADAAMRLLTEESIEAAN